MSESLDDATKTEQWQRHLEYLATLEESRQPIVSCYVDLDRSDDETRSYLLDRAESIVRTWQDGVTSGFIRDALASALQQTGRDREPDIRGLAVFARGGDRSFCLPMRFKRPVRTSLTVDTVPHLYDLVALKDSSNCHVVLAVTHEFAAVFSVFLGSVLSGSAALSPDSSACFGRQWTRLRYLSESTVDDGRSLKDKIEILNTLMSDDIEGHLLFVGEERQVQSMRKVLPAYLARRQRDIHQLLSTAEMSRVLTECLAVCARDAKSETTPSMEQLLSSFYRDELAVLGSADSLAAVFQGHARTMIISTQCDLGTTNLCKRCGWSSSVEPLSKACGDCGSRSLRKSDIRQELLRMAEQTQCKVETVEQSEEIRRAGGVGCILRYLSRDIADARYEKEEGSRESV